VSKNKYVCLLHIRAVQEQAEQGSTQTKALILGDDFQVAHGKNLGQGDEACDHPEVVLRMSGAIETHVGYNGTLMGDAKSLELRTKDPGDYTVVVQLS
jgi:hypothetical protein